MAERTNSKWIHTFSNVILPFYANAYVPVAFVHKLVLVEATRIFLIFLIGIPWLPGFSILTQTQIHVPQENDRHVHDISH